MPASLAAIGKVSTVQRMTFSSGQVALYTMAAGVSAGYDDGYIDGEQADLDELTFYRDNAVLITLGGEKYHRWGCFHVSGRSYLIYNVELAEFRGYTPCLDCWE